MRAHEPFVVAGVLSLLTAPAAWSATFTVTHIDDSGAGSLRQAITDANAAAGADTIAFAKGLTGIINLQSWLPDLTDDVEINGPGAGLLTVRRDAGGNYRVFTNDGAVVLIRGLTVTNGNAVHGGGIANFQGTMTLVDCSVIANPGNIGGGVYNFGTMTVIGCNIADNTANAGGGVLNEDTVLTMIDTVVAYNDADQLGGGVFNTEGVVTLINCTVVGNSTLGDGGGLCNVVAGGLNLIGCTVAGNHAAGAGGGAFNSGTAELTHCTIGENTALLGGGFRNDGGATAALFASAVTGNSAVAGGGGVLNSGAATIAGCTIGDNTSTVAGGGGLYHSAGQLILTDSAVTGNDADGSGGGLFNDGPAAVFGCTFVGNTSTNLGGGLFNQNDLMLGRSTLSGNSAVNGGGLFSIVGNLLIIDTAVADNTADDEGGGVFVTGGSVGMSRCTISGNVAAAGVGGGLSNETALSLTDCTVSGNSAGGAGGGIVNDGIATVINCTITANSSAGGGGVRNSVGTFTVRNTVIAGNSTVGNGPDVWGDFNSQGNNLVGDASFSGGFTLQDLTGTDVLPLDPKLGPLADNGGFTGTHALLAGSPALNAGALDADGANDTPGDADDVPLFDQRGMPRVGNPDIGAFERQPADIVRRNRRTRQILVQSVAEGLTTGHVAAEDGFFAAGARDAIAACDLDGNGTTDIVTRDRRSGRVVVSFAGHGAIDSDLTVSFRQVALSAIDNSWNLLCCADIESDLSAPGSRELIWHHRRTGSVRAWVLTGDPSDPVAVIELPPQPDRRFAFVGCCEVGGKSFLTWRNAKAGELVVWSFTGGVAGAAEFAEPVGAVSGGNFQVVCCGDFDGDGRPDLLWSNAKTGANFFWRLGAASVTEHPGPAAPAAGFVLVGCADFFGENGRPDLLWRSLDPADLVITRMLGFAALVSVPVNPPPGVDGRKFEVLFPHGH